MNAKYMFIVAAMAVMLIGGTALATEDAFADKKKRGGYEKSQAVSQVNECGNGPTRDGDGSTAVPVPVGPINVGCQNTASQIQGDDNTAALASSQQFEEDD
ncbi:MAG: hypothetical protein ACRD8Z_09070 [Nitrososphaeraceae archaeon]